MEELPGLTTALILSAGLAIGGLVKGVTGVGLPLFAVPLVATFLDPRTTVVVVTLIATLFNVIQGITTADPIAVLRRHTLLIVSGLVGTFLGSSAVAVLNTPYLILTIALTVMAFIAYSLLGWKPQIPKAREALLAPVFGFVAGLLGGATSIYGPPLIVYLYCLNLPKREFVSSISVAYIANQVTQISTFYALGLLSWARLGMALLIGVPILVGFAVGTEVRDRIKQRTFSRFVLAALFLTALNLVRRALTQLL